MDQRDWILPVEMDVHKKDWQTETVRMQYLSTLKDLGYHLDMDLGAGNNN
jgi:hypothetical protein